MTQERATEHESRLNRSRTRVWAFRAVVTAVGICVALAAGETFVRVFDVGPKFSPVRIENYRLSSNPVLRYELLPGSQYGGAEINSACYRNPERTVAKPEGTIRIAVIGDSIAFGLHVWHDQVFPAMLEEFLNRYYSSPGRVFEVLNFGVTGYNAVQVVETLEQRALMYDPDIIIYAYCLNDVQDYSVEFERLLIQLNQAEKSYFQNIARQGQWFASQSRLFLLGRYLWDSSTEQSRKKEGVPEDVQWQHLQHGTYDEYFSSMYEDDDMWERVTASLHLLHSLVEDRSIPGYVVVFPILLDLDEYKLREVHTQVVNAVETVGLLSMDLLPQYRLFAKESALPFQEDALHPNALGHAFAAVTILRRLLWDGVLGVEDRDLERMTSSSYPEGDLAKLVMELFPLANGHATDVDVSP